MLAKDKTFQVRRGEGCQADGNGSVSLHTLRNVA